MEKDSKVLFVPRLYLYQHCPYCARVQIVLGHRKIPYQTVYLANDDEATPIRMIGAKQVPIFEYQPDKFMAESSDIIDFITDDKNLSLWVKDPAPYNHPPLAPSSDLSNDINEWFEDNMELYSSLYLPRCIKAQRNGSEYLPEFATASARDYFQHKKEDWLGSFDDHLAHTSEYLQQMKLTEIEALLLAHQNQTAGEDQPITITKVARIDAIAFSELYGLTLVRNIQLPARLKSYLVQLSQRTGVSLLFDYAV